MSRYSRILLFIYCITAVTTARAQMDSLVYGVRQVEINPAAKGELRVGIEAMPFMRDNEYKSRLVKGYTLPGVWIDPTVSYQPLGNLKLELGAHLLHFWGATRYPDCNYGGLTDWNGKNTQSGFHCVPVFRAQMQLAQGLNVVAGTLYGKSRHGLIAPLYNDELNLSADPETGVQVLWDSRPFHLDAWVNWENFIFKNDSRQESFTFGLSARVRPSRRAARAQWYIPVQMLFQHHGGEINFAAEDRTVKTWLNAAAGVGVELPLPTRLPVKLGFETTAAYFGQQSGEALPFDKGYGLLATASAQVWRCKAVLGYWRCKDFVSILGNPLYGAMSMDEAGLIFRKPQTLTARVEYTHELGKGFAWGLHADVFNQFDTDACTPDNGWARQKSSLNFAAGIYVRVCPSFLIKKF